MSAPQKQKPWHRRALELFSDNLPFWHKIEKDKKKYNRKTKHKLKDIDN